MTAFKSILKESLNQDIQIMHNINTFYSRDYAHFHDNYEITFVLTPNVRFTIYNREYITQYGSVLLINDNEIHHNTAPSNVEYDRYVLYVPPNIMKDQPDLRKELLQLFVKRPNNFENCIHLNPSEITRMLQLMEELQTYAQNDCYAKELRVQLKTAEIILLCNEILTKNEKNFHFQNERAFVIASYIQEHYQENLSLDLLCQLFFISKSHLIAIFKENLGITPNEYLVTTRIMKSREFLRKGMPVMKVCEMIGYNNESHFIRTFKRIVGITPKQYSKYYNTI